MSHLTSFIEVVMLSAALGAQTPVGSVTERAVLAMGTVMTARVEGPGSSEGAEAVVDAVEHHDRLLTTWTDDGPMAALNAAPPGVTVRPDPELVALLAEAEAWAVRTGRAFDPTLGALVDAWDLRGKGRVPTPEKLEAALARVGPATFAVDPDAGTVSRHVDGAWIDTGGFGKGAALRAAADTLRAHGVRRALLDLGGQILAVAARGEAPFDVAVAHPSQRDLPAATLRLADASAATSGNSERGLVVDGVRVGHILDPRTGRPAPWWGSVTVVSADALEADVLSTALYVMGPDAGLAWARGLPDVGVLFLVDHGGALEALCNEAMGRWLVEARPDDTAPSWASFSSPSSSSLERRFP